MKVQRFFFMLDGIMEVSAAGQDRNTVENRIRRDYMMARNLDNPNDVPIEYLRETEPYEFEARVRVPKRKAVSAPKSPKKPTSAIETGDYSRLINAEINKH